MTKGYIYTIAGDGTCRVFGGWRAGDQQPELSGPGGVAVDGGGDLLIADSYGTTGCGWWPASSCSTGCPFGLASMTGGDIYTIAG
jgi:hypothetical protein